MKVVLRPRDWLFIVAVVAVIMFVSFLPTPRERNAVVPADERHRSLMSEKQCSQCHTLNGEQPLPLRHPRRQDCFKCHRRAEDS